MHYIAACLSIYPSGKKISRVNCLIYFWLNLNFKIKIKLQSKPIKTSKQSQNHSDQFKQEFIAEESVSRFLLRFCRYSTATPKSPRYWFKMTFSAFSANRRAREILQLRPASNFSSYLLRTESIRWPAQNLHFIKLVSILGIYKRIACLAIIRTNNLSS